ncbi:MAG: 3-deoxy-manno-octulosonate cytidylyltransferase [Proteobacteria bacterium]|nr:3-deoxy-manno-octulosonate cytidylyltransferase [Pseudomonadota bacterium]
MRVIAVIPARMASSRFPGKPMALIHGMPMIGHCYERIRRCPDLTDTYVATCDQEIFDYLRSIGGNVVMTADTHERASDRAAEAMLKIEDQTKEKTDILVMVQGDEPMDTPQMVSEALQPMLNDDQVNIVNLMAKITGVEEFEDVNTVKVVTNPDGDALYFSREAVPSRAKWSGDVPMQKQVCVIPFRRDYLLEFNKTPEMPLEKIESVDMLRVLESGGQVRMVPTTFPTIGVDTPKHLEMVIDLIRSDELMKTYLS